jgi:hypothetical protein
VPKDVDASRIPFISALRYAYPQLGIDGKGRLWLTYRTGLGDALLGQPQAIWLGYARRLDGDHWTEPIEIHHSDGLLDERPVLLPHHAGGLVMINHADGRYSTPDEPANCIIVNYLDLPGEPVEPRLVPHETGHKGADAGLAREEQAIRRMRDYRIELEGRQYRLWRGEFHRHTEISFDGWVDGSLEDMFRYSIDAAALDWIGNGDHNGGATEYTWYLIQKQTDAFHLPGTLTTMHSYERSLPYPLGHRNCLFAKRGVWVLPKLTDTDPITGKMMPTRDDTRMLYRYLHEFDGVCAAHSCATDMGTDWTTNDPVVEPIVELYQGDRMSYEKQGAPRAGYDPQSGKEPANLGGWRPKGFVDEALHKGYKLGFQASSDHWSTHISFMIIVTEKTDRESLLAAVKKRHCYGATDNIVLDVKSGRHLQGDEFEAKDAPALQIRAVGTGTLKKIDILRDSEVVATLPTKGTEYRGTWTDPAPQPGTHYYYVRVLQEDGEVAWGSPMWITRPK